MEQALWLLGNLAGEGATARDAVLAVDALPPLVRCLERHQVRARVALRCVALRRAVAHARVASMCVLLLLLLLLLP